MKLLLLACIALSFLSVNAVTAREQALIEITALEADIALKYYFEKKNYERFVEFATTGADPTVWFENSFNG